MRLSKSSNIVILLFLFSLWASQPILGQTDKDCKSLKRELSTLEKRYNNETLPDKKIGYAESWLSKYEEWEKCAGWKFLG
jgi:hypothetical protein